jgi:cytochrome c biogenesis protein CcmG/thiol:disulfide interchange protein DsbE
MRNGRHLLALAIGVLATLSRADVKPGAIAPAFVARQTDGTAFNLADHKNRVVVIAFWCLWCPPCREEMKELARLKTQFADAPVDFIAISYDQKRRRGEVGKLAAGLGLPTALANDASANGFGEPKSFPKTFVVGTDGKVAKVIEADAKSDALEEAVNEAAGRK